MVQVFSNAARSELASSLAPSATSLEIVSGGDLFPVARTQDDSWFKITLQDANGFEIVYCQSHEAGSTVFGELLRGQEGTEARQFYELASVHHGPTAGNAKDWESKKYDMVQAPEGDFTAEVGKSYWLGTDSVITLPDTDGLNVGDYITFSKSHLVTPEIKVGEGSAVIQTSKDSDTSVVFDLSAEITFVFNGTDWEL